MQRWKISYYMNFKSFKTTNTATEVGVEAS